MCYPFKHPNGAPAMSLTLRMTLNRSAAVAQRFGARAETYDEHADLQRSVAERSRTPAAASHSSARARARLWHRPVQPPAGRALSRTAASCSPTSRRRCSTQCPRQSRGVRRQRDQVRDHGRQRARAARRALRSDRHQHDAALAHRSACSARSAAPLPAPGGVLLYATIGGKSFPEWREVLDAQDLPERPPRHPRSSRHRRRGAHRRGRRHALVPAPHEGGRRAHAARGLCRTAAGRTPPRHPRRRCDAWRTHHLAYRLWRDVAASQSSPSTSPA